MEQKTKLLRQIILEDNDLALELYGTSDANIKKIASKLDLLIDTRGNVVTIQPKDLSDSKSSKQIEIAEKLIKELYLATESGKKLQPSDVDFAISALMKDSKAKIGEIYKESVFLSTNKRNITPKSFTQKKYLESIANFDIVFGIGPAGTGKTYLAMASAVSALLNKEVEKIVLTRPAVEAGEKLGFLPGTLTEKIDPYLIPLYDALHDMMSFEKADKLIEQGAIEVAPLAFMRGRTLNDAFIILDEAQNTTKEQMKMFLTRLGYSSKTVITGDVTQTDLPTGKPSGLVEAMTILKGLKGIDFVEFSETDVVRHPLVQEIIKAFDRADKTNKTSKSKEGR